jgi:hypothetical protein
MDRSRRLIPQSIQGYASRLQTTAQIGHASRPIRSSEEEIAETSIVVVNQWPRGAGPKTY